MATRALNSGLWVPRWLIGGSPRFRGGTTLQRLTMGLVQKNQSSSAWLIVWLFVLAVENLWLPTALVDPFSQAWLAHQLCRDAWGFPFGGIPGPDF